MSVYPTLTQEDLINLRELADDQKNQRAPKNKIRTLK